MAATLRPAPAHRRKPEPIPADKIDRASLEIAWRWLGLKKPLDEMLAEPVYRRILENVARRHMRKRDQFDAKKLQAGDNDD